MSGASRRKGFGKRRGAGRHVALHGLGGGGHSGMRLRLAQSRFKSLERIAQPQKRQGPGGAAGLVRFGGELCIGAGLRANGFEQGQIVQLGVVRERDDAAAPVRPR